jgi:hypothetical protein
VFFAIFRAVRGPMFWRCTDAEYFGSGVQGGVVRECWSAEDVGPRNSRKFAEGAKYFQFLSYKICALFWLVSSRK